jgi:hypothetical protein
MEWKLYFRNVVKRYRVVIEGWPPEIDFVNLSNVSSSTDTLERLLRKWKQGITYWKKLTLQELELLEDERDAQIENGETTAPAPRRRRSDKGRKRTRHASGHNSGQDDDDDRDYDEDSANEVVGGEPRRRQPKRAKR